MDNKQYLENLNFEYDTYGNFHLEISGCLLRVAFDNYDLEGIPIVDFDDFDLPQVETWREQVVELISLLTKGRVNKLE